MGTKGPPSPHKAITSKQRERIDRSIQREREKQSIDRSIHTHVKYTHLQPPHGPVRRLFGDEAAGAQHRVGDARPTQVGLGLWYCVCLFRVWVVVNGFCAVISGKAHCPPPPTQDAHTHAPQTSSSRHTKQPRPINRRRTTSQSSIKPTYKHNVSTSVRTLYFQFKIPPGLSCTMEISAQRSASVSTC